MERLTKRTSDGQAVMDCKKCKADWTEKHGESMEECTALYCRNRLKDRVAAYEDTRLTPGEINSMKEEHFSGLEMAKLYSALTELKKYQAADKDGRIVVLPCKVGDTVYVLYGKGYIPCVVDRFRILANKDVQARMRHFTIGTLWLSSSAFGKTVFFTREEAEKVLEAMKDE